jgi:hypothetical protein
MEHCPLFPLRVPFTDDAMFALLIQPTRRIALKFLAPSHCFTVMLALVGTAQIAHAQVNSAEGTFNLPGTTISVTPLGAAGGVDNTIFINANGGNTVVIDGVSAPTSNSVGLVGQLAITGVTAGGGGTAYALSGGAIEVYSFGSAPSKR